MRPSALISSLYEPAAPKGVPPEGLNSGPALRGMDETDTRSSGILLELLHRAQQGDEEALDQLLLRVQQPVLGFLRKRLRDPRLERFVEDVLSEVLVRVFKHYRKCGADTERELVSWVLSIAHNESLRLLARRPLKYALLLGDRDPSETGKGRGPGSGVAIPGYGGYATPHARDQRSKGLRALLGVLEEVENAQSPDRALILYLKLVEDRSWQEIGDTLEISAGAAKRRFQRAQQSLEKQVLEGVQRLPDVERSAAIGFLKRAKLLQG